MEVNEKKPKSLMGNLNSPIKYDPNMGFPGMPGPKNMPNSVMSSNNMPEQAKQKTAEEVKKELEDTKKKLEGFKKKVLKKYKFTRFLSILPEQMLPYYAEDENMPVEIEKTRPKMLMMCIPEEQFKNITKIRDDVVSMIKETKENIWLFVKTEVDLWHYGLDSKFDLLDGVGASYPIYDNGFLANIRLANIHKTLVLRKFEKYVASYVIGGSLVRGVAGKDSDVDTFVIIDDTDVKRMPRLELLEKLRGMIHDFIREAQALSGTKNPLNVQVYLLTDFWQSVKDAHPVMFTFIRDGIPMYDRGTFIPWKLLLRMGKIKPSPEAVDMFMKSGDQNENIVKRRLLDAMVDLYWGVTYPAQALMMLAGNAPPEPKILVQEVKKILVDKEKLMGAKELKILERFVKMYKAYEHGKLTEVSGTEIDELKKEHDHYVKKMKELRTKIERRMQEHEAEKIHDEMFDLLRNIFGKKAQGELIKDLDTKLVKEGKVKKRILEIAKRLKDVKTKVKGKKGVTSQEMHKISGEAIELMDALTEFSQRKELALLRKSALLVSYGEDKKAEILLTNKGDFVIYDGKILKLQGKNLKKATEQDLAEASKLRKGESKVLLSSNLSLALEKELGDFEIEL